MFLLVTLLCFTCMCKYVVPPGVNKSACSSVCLQIRWCQMFFLLSKIRSLRLKSSLKSLDFENMFQILSLKSQFGERVQILRLTSEQNIFPHVLITHVCLSQVALIFFHSFNTWIQPLRFLCCTTEVNIYTCCHGFGGIWVVLADTGKQKQASWKLLSIVSVWAVPALTPSSPRPVTLHPHGSHRQDDLPRPSCGSGRGWM